MLFLFVIITEESLSVTRELSDVRVTRLPSSASFEAELSRANVPVTWYKDDQPLRRSQRLNLDVEGRVHRLTIRNVDSADEAVYSVVARNARSAARLSVQCEHSDGPHGPRAALDASCSRVRLVLVTTASRANTAEPSDISFIMFAHVDLTIHV